MSYERVLPRDAYNEANLLKCVARVCQWISDEFIPDMHFEHQTFCENRELETPGFEIGSDGSGEIFVMNLRFYLFGKKIEFWIPQNTRHPWPLKFHLVEDDDEPLGYDNDGDVFNEEGEMSDEFREFIKG